MFGPDGFIGLRALDLYAGTGAVGLDMLGHGASFVDFVEIDRSRAKQINETVVRRGFKAFAKVYRMDAKRALTMLTGTGYDIIFADPPYDLDPWEEMITSVANHNLANPKGVLIAEHSSRRMLPEKISGAKATNRKRYGDSGITVYSFEKSEITETTK